MIIKLRSIRESNHTRMFTFGLTDVGCDLNDLKAEVVITGKEARTKLQTKSGRTVFNDDIKITDERSVVDIVGSCIDRYLVEPSRENRKENI